MAQLKSMYYARYHKSLESVVKADVSGYFEKLLMVCMQVCKQRKMEKMVASATPSQQVITHQPLIPHSLDRVQETRLDIISITSMPMSRACTRPEKEG